jgi:hypothetical protein
MNPSQPNNKDIVTDYGSIRFTPSGLILEAAGSKITIHPGGVNIVTGGVVNINGAKVDVNNGALEVL